MEDGGHGAKCSWPCRLGRTCGLTSDLWDAGGGPATSHSLTLYDLGLSLPAFHTQYFLDPHVSPVLFLSPERRKAYIAPFTIKNEVLLLRHVCLLVQRQNCERRPGFASRVSSIFFNVNMPVLVMAFISLLVFPADEMCLHNLDGGDHWCLSYNFVVIH